MFNLKTLIGVSSYAALGSLLLPATSLAQSNADDSDNRLEEIVITSSRIPTPLRQIATSMSTLNADEIQLKGYTSLTDVLRTLPGISASNSGGIGKISSLRIRGESGFRTLFMIDGIKVSDPTGTQVGTQVQHLLTGNDLERVEVLRGPQGFSYGADAGGVVNILTRRAKQGTQGSVSFEGGEFGTERINAQLSAGNQKGDIFVSLADLQTDGFNSRVSDSTISDDDGYENTTAHLRGGWNVSEMTRLELVLRDTTSEAEFDGCGFPSSNDCLSVFNQTNFKLSLDHKGEQFGHYFAVTKTDVDRESIAAGSNNFSAEGEINRVEYTGHYLIDDSARLIYGADLEEEDIVSSSGESMNRDQLGIYLEYQNELIDNLFFTAGARQDDNDDFGEHLSYRVSTAYVQEFNNGSSLKYRATYGTGFRAPSMSELAYNSGPFAYAPATSANLKEETSQGYDLGIEYFGANDLYLELVYFDQEIEDEMFFDLVAFSGYLQASGISESTGVELSIAYPLSDQWGLTANATFNETESPDGTARIRAPEKVSNIGLQFTSLNQKLTVLSNIRFARDSQNEIFGVGRVGLDDYRVIDISANYRLSDKLKLFGRIENLDDEKYEEVTGYNSAGFSTYFGLEYSF